MDRFQGSRLSTAEMNLIKLQIKVHVKHKKMVSFCAKLKVIIIGHTSDFLYTGLETANS